VKCLGRGKVVMVSVKSYSYKILKGLFHDMCL
jgi:hypothetical protein